MRLYTFNISHFAEKARWALDRTGIRYHERVLMPGPHILTIRRLRQGATSVPAIVDEGRAIQGSSRIIDYIDERYLEPDRRLTPAEPELQKESLELERWLDAEIGEAARRFFYHHALPHRELVGPLFTQRGPWWGKMFCGLAYLEIAGESAACTTSTRPPPRPTPSACASPLDASMKCSRAVLIWWAIASHVPISLWPR